MSCQIKNITFNSDGNKLVGRIYQTKLKSKSPGILFLHGAGSSTSAKFDLWQQYLCEKGYTSFIFDCRGVGESEGKFADGGLNNRLKDAENALQTFLAQNIIHPDKICVIGNSMSGHTAIRLTQKFKNIKALILACSAAYSREAEEKKLDQTFTAEIRKENSWVNSPVFSILEKFPGKTLVVYGEKDSVIPKGIQQRYVDIVNKKGESHIIKNAGHKMILPSNVKEEAAMQELFKISAKFLDKICYNKLI